MQDGGTLTIHLLGGFRMTYAGQAVAGLGHARLQDLLVYLLLQRDRPVSRRHLAFLFWPDSTEKQVRSNLRSLWHRLRRTLPQADSLITAEKAVLQWRSNGSCWLDVAEFEAALARAGETDDPLPYLEQAASLYGGELLPGNYQEWLLTERERLAQAYRRTLSKLAGLHEDRRQYHRAIGHAHALLRHDPLHEPTYQRLMRLHALVGDRAAALYTYHTCLTVLRRELDVEPDHATCDLYQQLLKRTYTTTTTAIKAAPLVGRETEWARLHNAWRAAAIRPQLALITGETGIGKTRLADALAEWARRQRIPVLTGRCHAAGQELPYAPIVAWLHAQPLPAMADPWLRELARLQPEILIERPELSPTVPLAEKWQRLHLFQALAQAVLGNHSALLLLLDNVQWCDRDTLDWLHYLLTARRGQQAHPQILLVATMRSEAKEDGSRLAAWQTDLAHASRLSEIELGPLSPEATLALAEHVIGRSIDPSLRSLLYQGTEGHPLFIVEMMRTGLARHAPSATPDLVQHATKMLAIPASLPDRLRQVLEARLLQLSPPARALIELASVVGREFSYEVLACASDFSEDLLVNCLDECWRRLIIREQGENRYDFSHDKLREVAYTGLSSTRRRWLHGQVAQALETVYASDMNRMAGVIAGHYESAGQPVQAVSF